MIAQSRAERKLAKLLMVGFQAGLGDQSLRDELRRLQTQLSRLRRHRRWLQLQSEFASQTHRSQSSVNNSRY